MGGVFNGFQLSPLTFAYAAVSCAVMLWFVRLCMLGPTCHRHFASWIVEGRTVPTYYLAKPQPRGQEHTHNIAQLITTHEATSYSVFQ